MTRSTRARILSTISGVETTEQPRRLRRSFDDRRIAGVCGGLAEHFDVDAGFIRFGFLVASLIFGVGLVAYAVLWVTLPEPRGEGGPDQVLLTGNPRMVAGIALVCVGLLLLVGKVASWLGIQVLTALIAVGVGAFLLMRRDR